MKAPNLTLEEKIKVFIDKKWTYNPLTGDVISHKGKLLGGANQMRIYEFLDSEHQTKQFRYSIAIQKYQYAWYLQTGEVQGKLYYIDGNNKNLKWENISDDVKYAPIQVPRRRVRNDGTYTDEVKKVKKKLIKPKPIKIKKDYNYLNRIDLLYQIIISKGKGKLTDKAVKQIQLIVEGVASKLYYGYLRNTDKDDCIQEALLILLDNWYKFDERRYDDAFSYYTEIAKIAMVKGKTDLDNNMQCGEKQNLISINNFFS